MVDVNRSLFNLIPDKWNFDDEVGPFIRGLVHQIFQLRNRMGGDSDYGQETLSLIDSKASNIEMSRLNTSIQKLEAELITVRRQLNEALSEVRKLNAEIQTDARRT